MAVSQIISEVILRGQEAIKEWDEFRRSGQAALNGVAATARTASSSISGSLEKVARKAEQTSKSLREIGSTLRNIGGVSAVAITAPISLVGRSFINAASDANEFASAFNFLFEETADATRAWADVTSRDIARSTLALQDQAAAFQGLFSAVTQNLDGTISSTTSFGRALEEMGGKLDSNLPGDEDIQQAARLSQVFALLTQDLASFFNTAEDDALLKLRSGLIGETEPLRAFNVFLNENAVGLKAQQLGLKEVNGQLTDYQKIVARAAIILEQTATAQGDAARTSESYANQVKALSGAWRDMSVELGENLIPTALEVVRTFTEVLRTIGGASEDLQDIGLVIAGIAAVAGPVALVLGTLTIGLGLMAQGIAILVRTGPAMVRLLALIKGGLALLTGPIGIVVLAFAALYSASEDFRDAANNIADTLINVGRRIAEWVLGIDSSKRAVDSHVEALDNLSRAIANASTQTPEAIRQTLEYAEAQRTAAAAALAHAKAQLSLVERDPLAWAQAVDQARQNVSDLTEELAALDVEIKTYLDRTAQAGSDSADAAKGIGDLGEETEKTAKSSKKAKEEAEALRKAMALLASAVRDPSRAFQELSADTDTSVEKVEALQLVVRRALEEIRKGRGVEASLNLTPDTEKAENLKAAMEQLGITSFQSLEQIAQKASEVGLRLDENFRLVADSEASETLRQRWDDSLNQMEERSRQAATTIRDNIQTIAQGGDEEGGGVFGTIVTGADLAWQIVTSGAEALRDGVGGILRAMADTVASAFQTLASTTGAAFTGITNAAQNMGSVISGIIDRLIGQMKKLEAAANAAIAAVNSAKSASSGSGGGSLSLAQGGRIYGPGTGTSDSVPIWASTGEFVNPARSVRYYGQELFEWLRRMRLPKFSVREFAAYLRSTKASAGHMARGAARMVSGGVVRSAGINIARTAASFVGAPRLALGGAVSARIRPSNFGLIYSSDRQRVSSSDMAGGERRTPVNLTLNLEGGRRLDLEDLLTPDATMSRLVDFANTEQLASAGRKPRWYR